MSSDRVLINISYDSAQCFCFRWKGENVATTEVTEILGKADFIQEANVYGVQVPGTA